MPISAKREISLSLTYSASAVSAGIQKTSRELGDFVKGLSLDFDVLRSNAELAFGVLRSGAESVDLRTRLGSQLQGIGQDLDVYLGNLDSAAAGTISRFDLMEIASNSLAVGISNNTSKLASLFGIVRQEAQITGDSVQSSFTKALENIEQLDTSAIEAQFNIDTSKAFADYARAIGTTTDELSDFQKQQVILNEIINESGGALQDAEIGVTNLTDRYDALGVKMQNAIDKWKEILALSGAGLIGDGGAFDGILDPDAAATTLRQLQSIIAARDAVIAQNPEMTAADQWAFTSASNVGDMEAARAALEKFPGAWNEYRIAMAAATDQTGLTSGALDALIQQLFRKTDALYENDNAQIRAAASTFELTQGQSALTDATNKTDYATQSIGVTMALAAGEAATLRAQANALEGELYDVAGAANIAGVALRNALMAGESFGRFQGASNKIGRSEDNPLFRFGDGGGSGLRGGVEEIFDDIQTEFQASLRTGARTGVSDAQRELQKLEREAQQRFERMGGFVDRALQFDTAVKPEDFLLDKFGLRNQNASSELVRQLQDVADRASEGMRSRFLDENPLFAFLNDANLELVQAKAIATIRAIQEEGKHFELIPFDKFLEDVRELEAAEQRRADFRAKAISALGTGSTAAVDKALGIDTTDSSQAGAELAQSLISTFDAQIEAQQGRILASGELFGEYFRKGLTNKFAGIADELVNLVLDELDGVAA